MAVLGQAWVTLGTKDTDLRKGLSNAERMTKDFAAKAGAAFASVFAVASAGAIVRDVIETGKNMERLNNSFKAITGSSAGAAAEIAFLRSETERLGQNTLSAAQGLKTIEAAAMGTKLAGQGTRDIFTAVSEAATVLGLRSEETEGALLAIGQMMSKGKVQAEELRGQLGERLPGAFQIAARAMNVTTAELDEMLKQGQVVAEDFLPKFARALHEQYGGSVASAANSATAASNRFNNAVMDLKAALASSLLPAFTAVVKGATEVVKVFTDAEKKAQDLKFSIEAMQNMAAIQIDVDFRYTGMSYDDMLKEMGVGGSGGFLEGMKSKANAAMKHLLLDPTGAKARSGIDVGGTGTLGLHRILEDQAAAATKVTEAFKQATDAEAQYSIESGVLADRAKRTASTIEDATVKTQRHSRATGGASQASKDAAKALEEQRQATLKLAQTQANAVSSFYESTQGKFGEMGMDAGIRYGGVASGVASKKYDDSNIQSVDQMLGGILDPLKQQERFLESTAEMYAKIDEMRQNDLISEQVAMQAKAELWGQTQGKQLQTYSAFFGKLAGLQSSKIKEIAIVGKAAAVAQATIDGIAAVQAALKGPPGPPWSYAIAAATAGMTAMNVAQIVSTPAYAMGGRPMVGAPAIVGERGPELFVPDRPGTIIPNHALNGGSTRPQVNVYNYGSSKITTQVTESEIRIIARDEAKGVVRKDAPAIFAGEISNPNSTVSRQLGRSTQTQRRR